MSYTLRRACSYSADVHALAMAIMTMERRTPFMAKAQSVEYRFGPKGDGSVCFRIEWPSDLRSTIVVPTAAKACVGTFRHTILVEQRERKL